MNTPSREDRMVVIERDSAGTPTVWCDPEIADLVVALNKAGVRTVASCSGHGHRPGSIALADGRWLTIASDRETHRRIESMFPVDINGNPHTLSPAGKGGLQAIVADIRHSALVDDYEPQQIAFLESIADRLATEQPASSAPPGAMVGCYVVDEASCVPHFHPTYGSGLFVTAAAILAQPAPAAAVTWHRFEDRMPPSQEWVMAKSRLTGAVTPLSVLTDEAAADLIERYEGWHAIVAPAAEQDVPQGGDDGVVPLDLEQHEREALNYLGSALKDRNAKRAVDKALALCDFYAGRNQLTFCHRDLLQRKLLPAAAPAVAKMWLELVEQIAAPLNCRASEHVDANTHVIAAARRLAATRPDAPPTEQGAHPDDLAVDRFAAAMKAKLAKKRAEGRGGWDDPAQCSVVFLSELLQEHVRKGDPVDVGNFAMMLHQRGFGILPAKEPKARVEMCTHPGCKFSDGKPCAYIHCPNAQAVQA